MSGYHIVTFDHSYLRVRETRAKFPMTTTNSEICTSTRFQKLGLHIRSVGNALGTKAQLARGRRTSMTLAAVDQKEKPSLFDLSFV